MMSEERHTDDFKKLFETNEFPELPLELEEQVMLAVEIEKLRSKRRLPEWLNTNFIVFSVSTALLVLLSVFQFSTQLQFPMLQDVKILLLSSAGIFFILWLIQTADGLLQQIFSGKLDSSIKI